MYSYFCVVSLAVRVMKLLRRFTGRQPAQTFGLRVGKGAMCNRSLGQSRDRGGAQPFDLCFQMLRGDAFR